jgi:hypothetical protein
MPLMNGLDVWNEVIHAMARVPTRQTWGFTECGKQFTFRGFPYAQGSLVLQETDCNITCLNCIAEVHEG